MSYSTLPNIDIDDFQLQFPSTHELCNVYTAESATGRDQRQTLLEGRPAPAADDEILAASQAVGQLNSAPETPTSVESGRSEVVIFQEERQSLLEEASARSVAQAPTPSLSEPRFATVKVLGRFLPGTDPNSKQAQTFATWWSDRRTALCWQFSVACIVFIVNLSWTVWAIRKHPIFNGIGTMYLGNCNTTSNLNLTAHVIINIFSGLVLGASNFSMQILVAPTRKDVDKAHASRRWLDIGVPSFKNLLNIQRRRCLVWALLALSSGGLHLLWNSAVFKSHPIRSYAVAVVTSDYVADSVRWNITGSARSTMTPKAISVIASLQSATVNFEKLDKTECIKRYADPLTQGKNLVVVTEVAMHDNQNPWVLEHRSLLAAWVTPSTPGLWSQSQAWMCMDMYQKIPDWPSCSTSHLLAQVNSWAVLYGSNSITESPHASVSYCLSEGANESNSGCGLQFSTTLMCAVCVFNLLKCIGIGYTAISQQESRMVTIGDAIASFLQDEDPHTTGMSMLNNVKSNWKSQQQGPKEWRPEQKRWYEAASKRKSLLTIALCVAIIVVAIAFLVDSIWSLRHEGIGTNLRALWQGGNGLGLVDAAHLVGGPFSGTSGHTNFYAAVIFANSFQLIISSIYFAYNSLMTTYLVAHEWGNFCKERKALRMSAPKGIQRSSYFLTLPFKYSIPLLALSTALHFFISTSVFLVRTTFYDISGKLDEESSQSHVGFSSMGIILALLVGTIMVMALVLLAWLRKYPTEMPLVSTRSAAISANCHAMKGDEDAHLFPVEWGVVQDEKGQYKCTFTTASDVRPPVESEIYV